MRYGQNRYDFDKGVLSFTAPKQVQILELSNTNSDNNVAGTGYALFFHSDFLGKHTVASTIKTYGFFSYATNEALHLSETEENNILEIFLKVEQEYQHIDKHTQEIIVAQIDLLLSYCNRFYERQFITRKPANSELLIKMENLLDNYFNDEESFKAGLPTVEYFAAQLNLSTHYLSDMLRTLTGLSTQQHIQNRLIEKAKLFLSTTDLSVAEIAYSLGFEYPQSFNKLFKKRTEISPLEFRKQFR
ncbi:helix-turn-helix domain-containing protein [Chryseobacterium viscerum]|uniref:helix-turn-helix domain-containing protein n=1 Tax=Chryseobacterium viscerum TaxID=1037377 RepID=UPI0026BF9E85|nr:helix-turn-helix domain-containing protein [Chryseobacterium viscerum]